MSASSDDEKKPARRPSCDGVLFMAPGKTAKLTQRRYLVTAPAAHGAVRWLVFDECLKGGAARVGGGGDRREGYQSPWKFGAAGSPTLGAGYACARDGYIEALWLPQFKRAADPIDLFGGEFEILLTDALLGKGGAADVWRETAASARADYDRWAARKLAELLPEFPRAVGEVVDRAADEGFEVRGWSYPSILGVSAEPRKELLAADLEPQFSEMLPVSPDFERALLAAGFRAERTGMSDGVHVRYIANAVPAAWREGTPRSNPSSPARARGTIGATAMAAKKTRASTTRPPRAAGGSRALSRPRPNPTLDQFEPKDPPFDLTLRVAPALDLGAKVEWARSDRDEPWYALVLPPGNRKRFTAAERTRLRPLGLFTLKNGPYEILALDESEHGVMGHHRESWEELLQWDAGDPMSSAKGRAFARVLKNDYEAWARRNKLDTGTYGTYRRWFRALSPQRLLDYAAQHHNVGASWLRRKKSR